MYWYSYSDIVLWQHRYLVCGCNLQLGLCDVSFVDNDNPLVLTLCNGCPWSSDVKLLPSGGYACGNGYTATIFSGGAQRRVHELDGIGTGSMASLSHVTLVASAPLLSGVVWLVFFVCFWLVAVLVFGVLPSVFCIRRGLRMTSF